MKSVTVGLSVYNEEKNIASVLRGILKQRRTGWELKEILVYNDGSSDRTVREVKSVKNSLISLKNDGTRRGKTHRLSEMFKDTKGDILMMFDGDIRFEGDGVITAMVAAFDDPQVMLAGGNSTPHKPVNFFQECVNTTFSVFYRSRLMIKGGNNIFGATGSILAVRRTLAGKIRLPEIVNEDAYIYLYCISQGFKFKYVDDAVIRYTLPMRLSDYLRQAFRSHPEAVTIELGRHFGSLAAAEFKRSKRFYIQAVLMTFARQPLQVICMIGIHALCKPLYGLVSSRYKLSWFTASSTH